MLGSRPLCEQGQLISSQDKREKNAIITSCHRLILRPGAIFVEESSLTIEGETTFVENYADCGGEWEFWTFLRHRPSFFCQRNECSTPDSINAVARSAFQAYKPVQPSVGGTQACTRTDFATVADPKLWAESVRTYSEVPQPQRLRAERETVVPTTSQLLAC